MSDELAQLAVDVYKSNLAQWIIERWDAEVKNRPIENIHRRTLDGTWRQIYRHVTDGNELPRPKHPS